MTNIDPAATELPPTEPIDITYVLVQADHEDTHRAQGAPNQDERTKTERSRQ